MSRRFLAVLQKDNSKINPALGKKPDSFILQQQVKQKNALSIRALCKDMLTCCTWGC